MAKYPLSILDSISDGKMSDAFAKVLRMHMPAGSNILDPTAGTHLLWKSILFPGEPFAGDPEYNVTFTDINGGEGNEQQNLARAVYDRPQWLRTFDCVVYDPPYFIGEHSPREEQYGTYAYSEQDLLMYMSLVHTVIPQLLMPKGKVIVKCSDQYVVSERKFYPHHLGWASSMLNEFSIADIMIYRHHRMSPTAFQVKDRPCSVVMHSYFLIGVKK